MNERRAGVYRHPDSPSVTRTQIWEPRHGKQLVFAAVLLLGPGIVGGVRAAALAIAGSKPWLMPLIMGPVSGLAILGVPLVLIGTLAVAPRLPKPWFHRLAHTLAIEDGRALLYGPHGDALGDTQTGTLLVQKDNVFRSVGKGTVLAGALRLTVRDGTWVRVASRSIVAAWPGLPADRQAVFREIEDSVYFSLQRFSS